MGFNDDKAKMLIEMLPYIEKHSGKTMVIKYGGNAMKNERLKESVMEDIILMSYVGINIVVVHGGGPEITKMLDRLKIQSEFINGLRYTDEITITVAQMVLAGKVNKDLVKLIEKNGGKAIGLSGIDGSLIKAKKLTNDIDLGFVGEITSVNTELLNLSMNSGYIPVVSSIAIGENDTNSYNINADTCASKIASALKAEKLILLTDVPGVMTNPDDSSTLISTLRLHQIPKLTVDKVIKGGMIPKINCCVESVRMGVKKAHIIDGRIKHSILLELLSKKGIGTEIY